MPLRPFLDAIDEPVLVCDGGVGGLLCSKGAFLNRCFEGLNVTQPALVAAVRPLVRGVRVGTAGRQFSSTLGVIEAIG